MKNQKLKPVVFVNSEFPYYQQNTYQQMLLLKAMTVTDDPKELKRMVGVRAVADVYRTLDKLTLRKAYHEALSENNVSLTSVVAGIKGLAETSSKDTIRLKAYQTILRSLGLERYEDLEDQGKNWEEVLLRVQQDQSSGKLEADLGPEEYEVKTPEIPESVKKGREREQKLGEALYG